MWSFGAPQCEGIWRPPDAGSVGGAHGLQQHLVRRDAQGQAQRAIAIVRIEPIVAGAQHHAGGHLDGLVPAPLI